MKLNRLSLYLLGIFFILAGFNHFRAPEFYFPLIPPYLPNPYIINIASGFLEIFFGILLFIPATRKIAGYLILAMLIAFIPSHFYFIQVGGCIDDGLCTPIWVAWVRLIVIHPILMMWVYYSSKL
ncbi:MAG TPA: hypothetical protein ACFCUD_07840 [Cyclobacteriaceae bacterium]